MYLYRYIIIIIITIIIMPIIASIIIITKLILTSMTGLVPTSVPICLCSHDLRGGSATAEGAGAAGAVAVKESKPPFSRDVRPYHPHNQP